MRILCQSNKSVTIGADAAPPPAARIPCPHCRSFDVHASRRRWTENILRLVDTRVRRCYDCGFRFFVIDDRPFSANLFRCSDLALLAGLLLLALILATKIAYSAH